MAEKNYQEKNWNEEVYIYEYKEVDPETGEWVTREFPITNDDANRELIDYLRYDDQRTALNEEYERKHRDKVVHNGVVEGYEKNSYSDYEFNEDPIEQIPDPAADVFEALFPGYKGRGREREITITRGRRVLSTFPEAEANILYMRYGEGRKLEEICLYEAERTGVRITTQAMSARLKRLLEKFKKIYLALYPTP